MTDNAFSFCPRCGNVKIQTIGVVKWQCPACDFTLYNNVAAAVAVILADASEYVLFETRAQEPRKGFLALPGGFVNGDESAEQAVRRECQEETGIVLSHVEFVTSFPNTYDYKRIRYKTCDLFFSAGLPAGIESIADLIATAQKDTAEVRALSAVRIQTAEELAAVPLAFDSARQALAVWLSWRQR
ncbi:MAG: NUDIX domain-containing protein [Treponema sp.]|nr:NUDIX domain-containing protein [Treponema sp.]